MLLSEEAAGLEDGLASPRRYLAILAVSCGTASGVVDASIATVALPTLARDLGVSPSAAVSAITVYQLALVMTLLPFSALGERIGLRPLYRYGQAVFLVSTMLIFVSSSLPMLLTVRVLQALGAAATISVSSALVRNIYPRRHLGRGLSINSVVVSCAGALAPVMGGLLLSFATWPWVFAAAAPFALLSLWLGWRALPDPAPRDEAYDLAGALLCAATFGCTITGLETGARGGSLASALAITLAGIGIGIVFVRRELKSKIPILPLDLLAQPVIALSAMGGLFAFIASMVFILSLPFRLQQHFGFSAAEVGAVIMPWPLAVMAVAPVAGGLSDRLAAAVLGAGGMAIAVIALLLLAFLPSGATYWDIAWRMGICGLGFGLFLTPNSRSIIHSAPLARAASAGGLISTTRLAGQTLGASVLALLLSIGLGYGRVPVFVAAALASLAGACCLAKRAE